jgi:hypothetical protein
MSLIEDLIPFSPNGFYSFPNFYFPASMSFVKTTLHKCLCRAQGVLYKDIKDVVQRLRGFS